MAIEDKIDLLIAAIDRNTAAIAADKTGLAPVGEAAPVKRGRKGRAAEEAAAAAEDEAVETVKAAETVSTEKVWTKQEVMDLAMAVVNIAGKAETQRVVKTYAPKLAEVKEDDFAALVGDLEALRDSIGETEPEDEDI